MTCDHCGKNFENTNGCTRIQRSDVDGEVLCMACAMDAYDLRMLAELRNGSRACITK